MLCARLILFRIRHLHLSPQSIIISIMNTPNCFVNHFILHKWYVVVVHGNVRAKGVQRVHSGGGSSELSVRVCIYLPCRQRQKENVKAEQHPIWDWNNLQVVSTHRVGLCERVSVCACACACACIPMNDHQKLLYTLR